MSQYLKMEQEADDLLQKQKEIIESARVEKRDMTAGERDTFFSMQGAANALEANARALRDVELDELRKVGHAPTPEPTDNTRADYMNYLRTGTAPQNAVTLTDANGGYIVPEPIHGPFVDKVRKYNPIIGNAQIFEMSGDTILYLPRKVSHGVVTVATETGARSEQTAPTFGNITLRAFDHYTDQRASQTWLDSVAGSEELLLNWIYDDIFEQAEYFMVSGSGGTTESAGVFANTGASGFTSKDTNASSVVANTDLFQLYWNLHPKYRGAAKFYMNSTVLSGLSVLAHPGAADTPLITMDGGTARLFGKEIVEVESAPNSSADLYPILLADMSNAYAVGIHRNISILRDPYTAPPYIRYYGLARIGGTPWDRQAATQLHVK